jgi:general secretion pathway protein F/type IV pilus assembly protein PilC
MPTYQYIAKTSAGEEVTGAMQAETEAAVVRALDEKRLFPVHVAARAERATGLRAGRVRPRDVGIMYGQLSDLLKADVPVLRALQILSRATVSRSLVAVIDKVAEDVASGKPLADAMLPHTGVFTPLHVAMVRAGERAGFLEDVLANLAEFMERQDELRNKVLGAMVYPMLVASIGLAVAMLVLVWLVPKFRYLFGRMELPTPTLLLFYASDLVRNVWPVVLMLVVVAAVGAWGFLKSEYGRRWWDRWRLNIPVAGRAARLVAITRFCRVLGMMLKNGVPLLQALAISKDATGSVVLADSIEQAAENVRAGETLAEPLKTSGYFPPEILEMVAVAEESNQLEKTLLQIADTVERRTNRQIDLVVRLIEPFILVMMAVGIGFFGVSLVYPLFSMAGAIGK